RRPDPPDHDQLAEGDHRVGIRPVRGTVRLRLRGRPPPARRRQVGGAAGPRPRYVDRPGPAGRAPLASLPWRLVSALARAALRAAVRSGRLDFSSVTRSTTWDAFAASDSSTVTGFTSPAAGGGAAETAFARTVMIGVPLVTFDWTMIAPPKTDWVATPSSARS